MIGAMTDQSSPFTGFPVSPVYDGMTSTAVRDLLDVLSVPGVISFAGGAPAAESFEIDDVRECFDWVFANRGAKALQYSSTPGEPELREQAACRVSRTLPTTADQIQITTGSQEAIYLVGHAMLRPGDVVLVERPTYLAAVQAFASSGARLIGIPSDDDGAQPEALEELIREHDPRFVYLIPTFQNPSGVSMPAQRRREIAEVLLRTGAPLVEDDPYGELRFEGETAPQIAALPGMARQTLLLNSMSKIMSPGIRVGWIRGEGPIMNTLSIAKEAMGLHSSVVDQLAVARYLEHYDVDTCLIHYTDMNTQPWVSADNPYGWLWFDEVALMMKHELLTVRDLNEEIERGYLRPSALLELEERPHVGGFDAAAARRYAEHDAKAGFVKHAEVYARKRERDRLIKAAA